MLVSSLLWNTKHNYSIRNVSSPLMRCLALKCCLLPGCLHKNFGAHTFYLAASFFCRPVCVISARVIFADGALQTSRSTIQFKVAGIFFNKWKYLGQSMSSNWPRFKAALSAEWHKFYNFLEEHESFVLFMHRFVFGYTLGSMIGAKE